MNIPPITITEKTSDFLTAKKEFSIGIVAYAFFLMLIYALTYQTFGIGANGVSLLLVIPWLIAIRMRYRWSKVKKQELWLLLVLLLFVLGSSLYIVGYWHDVGIDEEYARNKNFTQLTKIVHDDPAFSDIKLTYSPFKVGHGLYHIQGTVASQTELKRFQTLCDKYGFQNHIKEVSVINSNKSKYHGEGLYNNVNP